ncbi:hypothetical protein [Vulcanisaeta souniana]|uniref:Uncharacterized protein n=2 Tax=Vulcanisaeta souniana TaxID=164452 RepID=A0A830E9X0_9CREN|nr:hypothetical protein [Vulcanisaeta souniana]BDR93243.1 hypothetical protein Vsou_23360 [Vulcanisaeta souniana JCM 11219]GGI78694.1 hypothetical protein GCM10007112_14440 [Vulcanisaeta souniana JCM 11219]
MDVKPDPEEEYVIMPLGVLERILRYAMIVCQEHCPAGRDPATCPYIVNLTRQVGLSPPPCLNDYGEYRRETFKVMIKDLERKYNMGIEEFINTVRKRKPRSLEEQTDFMEATFYLGVLRELSNMRNIYIAKGSNINLKEAVVVK